MLIVARFKDVARFTALSGNFTKTGLFIVYQIPSILPIAIPISALITSLLLFQRLSRTFELTAFRASGLSLSSIITPLLLNSVLFSIVNFSICAEIAPFCRRESKMLIFQETSENPLVLLQRQKLVRLKSAYLDMKVKDDSITKDLLLIAYNESNRRLGLISARTLKLDHEELIGENLALVSYVPALGFDSLVIENQASMTTAAPLFAAALKRNSPKLDVNALDLKMLRLSSKEKAAHVEILRRISLSLAVFTFTLLGCAFGIEEGRAPSKKNLLMALIFTLLILLSYLLAKELKNYPLISILAFLLPHPFVWACSTYRLHRIAKGRP